MDSVVRMEGGESVCVCVCVSALQCAPRRRQQGAGEHGGQGQRGGGGAADGDGVAPVGVAACHCGSKGGAQYSPIGGHVGAVVPAPLQVDDDGPCNVGEC